jgi:hypothetical protein
LAQIQITPIHSHYTKRHHTSVNLHKQQINDMVMVGLPIDLDVIDVYLFDCILVEGGHVWSIP